MSDVSKTNETLIAEAREFLASENAQYYDSSLVRSLVDALEAATRVPVQGEPNDELIEYALDYIENGTMRPERREALRALASRAAVPDAATGADRVTEGSVRHVKRLTTELQRKRESLNDQRREYRKLLDKAYAKRDAATAALERVRAECKSVLVSEEDPHNDWNVALDHLAKKIIAALDGAPEPEWEEHTNYGSRLESGQIMFEPRGRNYATHQQTARFGPWLPVEGESKP